MTVIVGVPEWLDSYDAFADMIRDAIADEPPTRQGTAFSRLAAVLLPATDAGRGFTDIQQSSKKSHDGGIDALSGEDADGRQLVIQSKLTLDEKKTLDSILSYFFQFEAVPEGGDEDALFDVSLMSPDRSRSRYVIVTLSRPTRVITNYEKSKLGLREFYDQLRAEGRLAIVDGHDLWQAARNEFSRSFVKPTSFELRSDQGWLREGNVRIGVVAARDLVDLYEQYGDGLFYENIRTFLGLATNTDRETVNRRILATVREAPDALLARNNGITIRASTVTDNDASEVNLVSPSIVNGCQTTMCLVEAGDDVPSDRSHITVKIVESENAWEVTHSANYQNKVEQIDLDLARFMRPQLVQQVAASRGIAIAPDAGSNTSLINSLLDELAATRITYEEVNNLYRGLFCAHPNNLFDNNYNKLRTDVLDAFHATDGASEQLFNQIFKLTMAAGEEKPRILQQYAADEYQVFNRFSKPSYQAYLALLAASAATRVNIDDNPPDAMVRATFLREFLAGAEQLIDTDRPKFNLALVFAYQVLMETGLENGADTLIAPRLHSQVTKQAFSKLYRRVLIRLDGDKMTRR